MSVSAGDRAILRDLAKQVAEVAARPEQAEKARLWTACNDLRPERAMVFADPQNGWKELDAAWLRLACEDPMCRGFEAALRRRLIRHTHIHDDFPILDTFPVHLRISGNSYDDYGLKLEVTRSGQADGAYHIEPAIRSERDVDRLHFRPIEIDHKGTDRAVEAASELFGDILKVRKVGKARWRYGLTRVLIHMRGLDQMMLDMYDHPDLLHRLMAFLRDDFLREIDLFEQANAVSLNNGPDDVTGSGGLCPTRSLPGGAFDGPPKVRHCLCWGESQETGGVGPAQFEAFVLRYQLPLFKRFGLVDFGCCEPLDRKLDLLMEKVPNLRWLAVPTWANRALAAEKIGKRYVYVYKPNPAFICAPTPDWAQAEREVRETLNLARGCAVHVVMKDTHTFCNEPGRITRWTDVASRLVREAA